MSNCVIDNFAVRNFTNDAIFDDTLSAGDGLLEAGNRVPLDRLRPAMEDWFRRKGYLKPDEKGGDCRNQGKTGIQASL